MIFSELTTSDTIFIALTFAAYFLMSEIVFPYNDHVRGEKNGYKHWLNRYLDKSLGGTGFERIFQFKKLRTQRKAQEIVSQEQQDAS